MGGRLEVGFQIGERHVAKAEQGPGDHGVRAIHQPLPRRLAGAEPAAQIGGQHQHGAHLAPGQRRLGLLHPDVLLLDVHHLARLHRLHQQPARHALTHLHQPHRDLAYVGVDGVAKQQQLDQRDHHHHAERQPVPCQLPEFFWVMAQSRRRLFMPSAPDRYS